MNRFADQCTDLALAAIPTPVLPPGGIAELARARPSLAAFQPLYFEVRLGAGGPIDISQQFHRRDDGAASLARLAAARSATTCGEAARGWSAIADLAAAWQSDPELADWLDEVFLEHDLDAAGQLIEVPAVFAGFRGSALAPPRAVETVLDILTVSGAAAWRRLRPILRAGEGRNLRAGRIVGTMLSRGGEVRAMLRGLDRGSVGLLGEVLPNAIDPRPLAALLAQEFARPCDRVLVIGDDGEISPHFGVEVVMGDAPEGPAIVRTMLDWLVGKGLADPARAAALAGWRGEITPLSASAPWPDALIARALAGERDRLIRWRYFVSHFKFNIRGGRIAEAKAYLAFLPSASAPCSIATSSQS